MRNSSGGWHQRWNRRDLRGGKKTRSALPHREMDKADDRGWARGDLFCLGRVGAASKKGFEQGLEGIGVWVRGQQELGLREGKRL